MLRRVIWFLLLAAVFPLPCVAQLGALPYHYKITARTGTGGVGDDYVLTFEIHDANHVLKGTDTVKYSSNATPQDVRNAISERVKARCATDAGGNAALVSAMIGADNDMDSAPTQDFENASVTRPYRRLAFASFPATCTANREFLERSDPATAGQVVYVCNSAGTGWDLVGDGGGGSSAWSGLTAPTANLSMAHAALTTTFTYNAATGALIDLFNVVDTTGNTGTGHLFNVNTVGTSAAKPVRFTAGGTANGVEMSTAGIFVKLGTGGLDYGSLLSFPAACGANLFATQIGATPGCTQPSFSNLSGTATKAQLPAPAVFTDQANTYTAGPQNLNTQAVTTRVANEGVTGTGTNLLAKLTGAPSAAIKTATADTDGAVGICVAGCGTTGGADIAVAGQASCVFDGATTAGNYVQISSTTAGDCKDAGATYPATGAVIGRVLSTNAAGGTFNMALFGPAISIQKHNVLSSTHGDTLAASVVRGDIIIGNATPAWARLAVGTANQVVATNGTDPAWTTLVKAHLPGTVVYNDQVNTFTSAGTINLSAASATTGLTVPVAAGAAPTANGVMAYDSTANNWVAGVNTVKNFIGQAAAALTSGQLVQGGGNGQLSASGFTVIASGTAGVGPSKVGTGTALSRNDHDHRSVHALEWFFPGTPSTGVQNMTLTFPDGALANIAILDMRVTVNTTSASSSTFNIQRCTATCTGAATFADIYSTVLTLAASTRTVAKGSAPDQNVTSLVSGDQFKASMVTIGASLADVTITMTVKWDTKN